MEDKALEMATKKVARQTTDEPNRTASIMEKIPIRKIYDQFQYLDNVILPSVQLKKGRESVEYKFFAELLSTLVWAAALTDQIERTKLKLGQSQQLLDYFKKQTALLEKELLKYTTIEEIFLSDGLDRYSEIIARRMQDLLTNSQTKK